MDTAPEKNICKVTGYRLNTRNLVISGVDHQLDNIERKLNEHHISLRRIRQKLAYDQIQSVVNDAGDGMLVYLVQTDDFFGSQLHDLTHNAQQYLDRFDSVDGLFWIGGESSGAVGRERIKVHGDYIGVYETPREK